MQTVELKSYQWEMSATRCSETALCVTVVLRNETYQMQ